MNHREYVRNWERSGKYLSLSLFQQPGLAGLIKVMQSKAHEDDVEVLLTAVAVSHKVAMMPGRLIVTSQSPAACIFSPAVFRLLHIETSAQNALLSMPLHALVQYALLRKGQP